jgi:hypothetical protein
VHADTVQEAELEVTCDQGEVHLGDGILANGRGRVPLNRPIELTVTGWQPRVLSGVAADGRSVRLDTRPAETGVAPIDAELVVDRSGSMGERCADGDGTKFSVLCDGLRELARALRSDDRVHLWEFANAATLLGAAQGRDLEDLVERLTPPGGGTEIGKALAAAASSESGDIVVVTDGKSHALDVHALSRTGERFTVVLVGEDSLEANVGHLAGLSGGQLFVVAGVDAAKAIIAAFKSVRSAHILPPPVEGMPTKIALRRRGMTVTAEWSRPPAADVKAPDCIGSVVAALALPLLPEDKAAALAEAHGLGSHLTSLVLVDEEGEAQPGLSAMRRVPSPTPRTAMFREFDTPRLTVLDQRVGSMDRLALRFLRTPKAPPPPADLGQPVEYLAREARSRVAELKSLTAHIDDLARQAHEQAVRASGPFEALAGRIDDFARLAHEQTVRTSEQFETFAVQIDDLARQAHEQAVRASEPFEALAARIIDLARSMREQAVRASEQFETLAMLMRERGARGALNCRWLVGRVDWSREPERLRRADLSVLGSDVAEGIRNAAQRRAVLELAEQIGVSPLSVVVALLARAEQHRNRNAARLFRAVLGRAAEQAVTAAAAALGLE